MPRSARPARQFFFSPYTPLGSLVYTGLIIRLSIFILGSQDGSSRQGTYQGLGSVQRGFGFVYARLQNSRIFAFGRNARSCQAKGLERGWKRRVRLGREAKNTPCGLGRFANSQKKNDCFAVYVFATVAI